MSNQELIELAQKINNYQNSIYKAKLHSAFENCSIHYNSSRYTKDADYVYATVEVDSTSPEASKNIKNGLYKVPKKFDDYVIATEKFYNEIENAKMSDFKRKELKEKMQKEYNMANDMLYMDLNVDKKGLKLKEITTKGIEKAREKEKPKTIIIDDNGKEHEINDDDAR